MRLHAKFLIGLVACFALGVAVQKYSGKALRKAAEFVNSPGAAQRVDSRGWDAFRTLQHSQGRAGTEFQRYVETGLLPLVIEEKQISESYSVPKNGGAITSIGSSVIVLDRLGRLYRYDLTTASFAPLQIPRLPNNLEAYVHHRPDSRYDLLSASATDEFRALDIQFLSDRKELAVSFDKFDPGSGKLNTAVSVIPIDVSTLAATGSWKDVFTSDSYAPSAGITTSGGRMAYRGGGKLYVTIGDHYVDPKVAQDPNTTFGKIIEVDIPAHKWRIFTSGHRNPQGLTFVRSGQLISTEHGPEGGDELNVITEGSNYGWPNVTLGTAYGSYDWDLARSPIGSHAGYTAPIFAWVPSIAVSQLIEIKNFQERWNGDLLIASLKGSSLYRLRLDGGRVLYAEPIWIGQRIRDIAQAENGTIVLWTDDGDLLFIQVDKDQLALKRRMPDVVSDALTDTGCMVCHHFGPTNPGDFAPTLSNLLNRPIASDAFRYSAGLRARRGTWTKDLLSEFLSDPDKFASGTSMPRLAFDPEKLTEIVDGLVRASSPATGQGRASSVTGQGGASSEPPSH